ncbi:MAG: YihY/virulence factor BrkB family protein [Pseudorhodobacter sp.]|nr:YihY/virulence factor BrkB family protein [Frankiaceae bacterium]
MSTSELRPDVVQADGRSPARRATRTAADAARPLPRGVVRRSCRLVADVWRKSDRDRVLGLSGENAFMAVLTVFPTLLVFAAVLGQLQNVIGRHNADRVRTAVFDFLDRILTSSAQPAIDTAKKLFDTDGNALTIALVLALASTATAFAGIVNTVTLAYDVQDRRGWWKRRLVGLIIGAGSILTGAVVITAIVIGPLFGKAADVVTAVGLSQEYAFVWSWVRFPVAFLALIAWATTLFHQCPDRPARWRAGLPGGVLTALLWLAASLGFSTYLKLVVPRSPVLGALGGGLILMTWFYLLCLGLLLGAELNAVLLARRRLRAARA